MSALFLLGAADRISILNWTVENTLAEYNVLGGDLIEDQPLIDLLKQRDS